MTLPAAGVTQEPSECLFLDDSTSNMRAAKAVGWRTVLVGRHARDSGDLIDCEHADYAAGGDVHLPRVTCRPLATCHLYSTCHV